MAEGIDNGTVVETPAESGHVETAPGTSAPEASSEPAEQASADPQEEMVPISRYKALQSQWTKDHGELLALRKAPKQASATQAQPSATPGANDITATLQGVVAPLVEKVEMMEIQSTLSKLQAANPDTYADVAPMMQKVLEDNPAIWQTGTPLELAYQVAEAQYLKSNLPSVVQKAQARDARTAADKQLGSGTKGRPATPEPETSYEDTVRSGILRAADRGKSIFG